MNIIKCTHIDSCVEELISWKMYCCTTYFENYMIHEDVKRKQCQVVNCNRIFWNKLLNIFLCQIFFSFSRTESHAQLIIVNQSGALIILSDWSYKKFYISDNVLTNCKE